MKVNFLEGIKRMYIVFVAIGLVGVFYFAIAESPSTIEKIITVDGNSCTNSATDLREVFGRLVLLNFCADKTILLNNEIDSSQKPWDKYSTPLGESKNQNLHLEDVTPEKQAELEKLWGKAMPEIVISDYKLTQSELNDIQSLIEAQKKKSIVNAIIYSLVFLLSVIVFYLITRFIVNGFKKSA